MSNTIKNKIIKAGMERYTDLEWFQPTDFKIIDEERISNLKRSLMNNGLVNPFYIWHTKAGKKYIIDGHIRQIAIKDLVKEGKITIDKVPVVYLDIKTKNEAKKILLIFNSHYSDISKSSLKEFVVDIDLNFLKYEADLKLDLSQIILADDDSGIDQGPIEPPKKPKTKLGDFYELGSHRLICGDCTDLENTKSLMAGGRANLMVTSPPYWVGKDYETQKNEKEVDDFIDACCQSFVQAMSPDNSRMIVNTGSGMATRLGEKKTRVILLLDKWINSLYRHDWFLRHIRHWIKGGGRKGSPISPKTDFVYSGMEYLLTFYNSKSKNQRGQNRLSAPWCQQSNWNDIPGDKQDNEAGFPIELPRRFIELYSKKSEIVFEPFCGNGTTLIACESTDRKCYSMELSPAYCDVIVQRYVDFVENPKIKKNGKPITWKVTEKKTR